MAVEPGVLPSRHTPPGSRRGDDTVWSRAVPVGPRLHAQTTELETSPIDRPDGIIRQEPDLGAPWLAQVLVAQQLPQVPVFTGEERNLSGESFEGWREQFKMVATLGRWNARTKLVNLVSRLRGQAYSFYRSCTMTQRADYDIMVGELLFSCPTPSHTEWPIS